MLSIDVKSRQLPSHSEALSFASKLISVLCRDLVFIFPTLSADFKDPMQNRNRVPALWAKLHIALAPQFF